MTELANLFRLDGRVAVVTGAAGLLGAEFCRTLAAAGAAVLVADLDSTAARSVAKSLAQASWAAQAVPVDVTSPESVQSMTEAALEAFGRLDILVNSAALDPKFDPQRAGEEGGELSSAFEDYPLQAWQQALDVNLTGMFLACQAAVQPMLRQGSGVIINLSSIYGLAGPDQRLYQQPGQRTPGRRFRRDH